MVKFPSPSRDSGGLQRLAQAAAASDPQRRPAAHGPGRDAGTAATWMEEKPKKGDFPTKSRGLRGLELI